MTMQPQDEAALALFQANRKSPEMESLLDAFFNFPTREEYDRTLDKMREALRERRGA
jgi:hypothetical protein